MANLWRKLGAAGRLESVQTLWSHSCRGHQRGGLEPKLLTRSDSHSTASG